MGITDERKALLEEGFSRFEALIDDGREQVTINEDAAYISAEIASRFTAEQLGLYAVSASLAANALIKEAYQEGYFAGSVDAASQIGAQLQAAGFDFSLSGQDAEGNKTPIEQLTQPDDEVVEGTA